MSARDDYPELAIAADESGYPVEAEEVEAALAELDRLRRWKAEATEVLRQYDPLNDALVGYAKLGETIAAAATRCVLEYRAHVCRVTP